jgi:hypothetical protein
MVMVMVMVIAHNKPSRFLPVYLPSLYSFYEVNSSDRLNSKDDSLSHFSGKRKNLPHSRRFTGFRFYAACPLA